MEITYSCLRTVRCRDTLKSPTGSSNAAQNLGYQLYLELLFGDPHNPFEQYLAQRQISISSPMRLVSNFCSQQGCSSAVDIPGQGAPSSRKCDCVVPEDCGSESLCCTAFHWSNDAYSLLLRTGEGWISILGFVFCSIYFCVLVCFVHFISVFLLMLLLLHSLEALGNGWSSTQALGQEMSDSYCFKMCHFKQRFSLGEIGRIRAQAQKGRIGWISLTFSWSAGCYLLHQDPSGILLKGMSPVIKI